MKAHKTKLAGCFILEPNVFGDHRGYFFESYNEKSLNDAIGQDIHFVQDNQSFSSYGVIRGLHAQSGMYAQAKLVRVLKGAVLDVAVDFRPESPTYGQHITVLLSAENRCQLYIPRGFLHGFVVVSEQAEFFYKCDNFYYKDAEIGVRYDDPTLSIDWTIPIKDLILSEKDKELPFLDEIKW